MTVVYAEEVIPGAPVTVTTRGETRTLWLESFDGSVIVPIDGRPTRMLRGAQGLTKPPEDVVVATSPGVPGGFVEDVRVLPRVVMLPLQVKARTQGLAREAVTQLREVLRWRSSSPREGSCYLVGSSAGGGVRRMTVTYQSGLEGEDSGLPNLARFELRLVAVDPWAYDVATRRLEFFLPATDVPFLSDDPADTWETRSLAASTVFGANMPIDILSDAPVYPRVDIVGPFAPALTVEASTGMSLAIPAGIPGGSTLTVVTDPRRVSIRLDDTRAAGRIARPWRLGNPFLPGMNRLSVIGTGATDTSRVLVSWRGAWESLW